MAGKWDSNLKRLVEANPQEFVGWLVIRRLLFLIWLHLD